MESTSDCSRVNWLSQLQKMN